MYLSFLIRQGSGCLGEQSAAELVSDLQYISAPANSIVLSPKYNPVFLSWLSSPVSGLTLAPCIGKNKKYCKISSKEQHFCGLKSEKFRFDSFTLGK